MVADNARQPRTPVAAAPARFGAAGISSGLGWHPKQTLSLGRTSPESVGRLLRERDGWQRGGQRHGNGGGQCIADANACLPLHFNPPD